MKPAYIDDGIAVTQRIIKETRVIIDTSLVPSIYDAVVSRRSLQWWLWPLVLFSTVALVLIGYGQPSSEISKVIVGFLLAIPTVSAIVVCSLWIHHLGQLSNCGPRGQQAFSEVIWPNFKDFRDLLGFWPDKKFAFVRTQNVLMNLARRVTKTEDYENPIRLEEFVHVYKVANTCIVINQESDKILDEARSVKKRINPNFPYGIR